MKSSTCNNNGQHLQRWQEQLLLHSLVRKVNVQCLLKGAYESAYRLNISSIEFHFLTQVWN